MADPLMSAVAPSRRHRAAWRWRCWRAERLGRIERDASTLRRLRIDLTGQRVSVGAVDGAVSELVFECQDRLRLGWVHRPTLRRLRSLADDDGARLVRADHSGRLWALYIGTRGGVVPLLTSELRLRPAHGGIGLGFDHPAGDRPPVPA